MSEQSAEDDPSGSVRLCAAPADTARRTSGEGAAEPRQTDGDTFSGWPTRFPHEVWIDAGTPVGGIAHAQHELGQTARKRDHAFRIDGPERGVTPPLQLQEIPCLPHGESAGLDEFLNRCRDRPTDTKRFHLRPMSRELSCDVNHMECRSGVVLDCRVGVCNWSSAASDSVRCCTQLARNPCFRRHRSSGSEERLERSPSSTGDSLRFVTLQRVTPQCDPRRNPAHPATSGDHG